MRVPVGLQEAFDVIPQGVVAGARVVKDRRPSLRSEAACVDEQRLESLVAFGVHGGHYRGSPRRIQAYLREVASSDGSGARLADATAMSGQSRRVTPNGG